MQLNVVAWNKECHGNTFQSRLDLVESLCLVSGSLVRWDWVRTRPGCALVRAGARRGWSEGAGAHWTRVDWEQVEDTRTLPALAGSCLHHTLHYGEWRNQLIASIPSNRHELMNSVRKIDVFIYCVIALLYFPTQVTKKFV